MAEQRRARAPELNWLKARLAEIDAQISNMVTAIKSGFRSETLKRDLEAGEREKERLQERMAQDVKRLEKITTMLPDVTQRFKRMVEEFATVTQSEVKKARTLLQGVLGQQITLHPSADGRERYLTAEMSGDYAGLIRLLARKINVVEGRGFEPPTPTLRTLCSPN